MYICLGDSALRKNPVKIKLETSDTYLLQNSQHLHQFVTKPVGKFRKSF